MEILVKLEHQILCRREKDEQFSAYEKWIWNLTSQMKDIPENKEIVKICGIKTDPIAWFLTSSSGNTS